MNDLKDIIIKGLILLWLVIGFGFLGFACLIRDFSVLMIFVRGCVLVSSGILVVMLSVTVYRLTRDLMIKLKKYITESDNNNNEEE